LLFATASVLVVLGSAWYFRIWSWRDLVVFQQMSRECHPVWKDLHWARVHAGQDVEEVIAHTGPVSVTRFDRYVELRYQSGLSFTGVRMVARDGQLVDAVAWSCTWHKTFFDELTPSEWEALSRAFGKYCANLRDKED